MFGGGGGANSAIEGFNNATQEQQAFFNNPQNQAFFGALGFKRGGKVKKTPGEFSHASNPIDVMQDGAKIGEMTGGEAILNLIRELLIIERRQL